MVSLKIEVKKKDFVWIVPLVAVLVIGVVYAYGTFDPVVMGHSAGEVDFSDGVNGDAIFNNNVEVEGNITLGGVSKDSWPVSADAWSSEQTGCYEVYTGLWNTWVGCNAGYVVTAVWFAGAGITHGHVRCCQIR